MLPFRLRRGFGGQSHIENENDNNGPPPPYSESDSISKLKTEEEEFFPSIWDVLKVRYILQWKLKKLVPPELVDSIIDAAEYWPSIINVMDGKRTVKFDRDQVLLKTVPLCFERKVCFILDF